MEDYKMIIEIVVIVVMGVLSTSVGVITIHTLLKMSEDKTPYKWARENLPKSFSYLFNVCIFGLVGSNLSLILLIKYDRKILVLIAAITVGVLYCILAIKRTIRSIETQMKNELE